MAKILSHVWSSISGSVGGITYLNGPHHSIIARARVAPVQPGTLRQFQAKIAWNAAASIWETLSEAVQGLWDDYAQTCTFAGKQGNYTVTGRLMFMAGRSLQNYSDLVGLYAPVYDNTAPVVPGFLLPTGFVLLPPVAIGDGFAIGFEADANDATAFFTQVSGAFGKERHFWKGPWRTIDDKVTVVAAAGAGTVDYLGLTPGMIYFVRVKAVADDAPGRTSQEWFGRVVAATTGP